MPRFEPPEQGTLIISALLLLGLAFTGYWILVYVRPDGNPEAGVPWFLGAAAAIVVVGTVAVLVRRRGRKKL